MDFGGHYFFFNGFWIFGEFFVVVWLKLVDENLS